MRIVTVSREFGSGGREVGKRLADALGFAYYDKEILSAIATKSQLDEAYVERLLKKPAVSYPVFFRRTFAGLQGASPQSMQVLALQQKIIRELGAKENCVIVGRGADVVLKEQQPLNLFIYADMKARVQRCRERAAEDEYLSDAELQKKIRQVDAGRRKYYELLSNISWGSKEAYHLCVNTSGREIKKLIPWLAAYAKDWFEEKKLP